MMTKKQLIENMKDFDDDAIVFIRTYNKDTQENIIRPVLSATLLKNEKIIYQSSTKEGVRGYVYID